MCEQSWCDSGFKPKNLDRSEQNVLPDVRISTISHLRRDNFVSMMDFTISNVLHVGLCYTWQILVRITLMS